jgi:transposase-like protein
MTKLIRYKCKNCGNQFEAAVFTEREVQDAIKEKRPHFPVCCPTCRSQYLEQI